MKTPHSTIHAKFRYNCCPKSNGLTFILLDNRSYHISSVYICLRLYEGTTKPFYTFRLPLALLSSNWSVSRPGNKEHLVKIWSSLNRLWIVTGVQSKNLPISERRAVNSITQDCYIRPHHVTQSDWYRHYGATSRIFNPKSSFVPRRLSLILFCRDLEI